MKSHLHVSKEKKKYGRGETHLFNLIFKVLRDILHLLRLNNEIDLSITGDKILSEAVQYANGTTTPEALAIKQAGVYFIPSIVSIPTCVREV